MMMVEVLLPGSLAGNAFSIFSSDVVVSLLRDEFGVDSTVDDTNSPFSWCFPADYKINVDWSMWMCVCMCVYVCMYVYMKCESTVNTYIPAYTILSATETAVVSISRKFCIILVRTYHVKITDEATYCRY